MNLTAQEKYKLLSWAYLVKGVRSNSVLYFNESPELFIKRNGLTISNATFRKYLNIAKSLGLVNGYGKHLQLKGWEFFIEVLGLETIKYFNQIINRQDITKIKSFKEMTDWVILAYVVSGKLWKQDATIVKKVQLRNVAKNILGSVNNKRYCKRSEIFKFMLSNPKFRIVSTDDYAKYVLTNKKFNSKIVTGSHSLSEFTGLSQKTCNNLLNKAVKKGLILRKIVKKYHDFGACGYATFENLKEEGKLVYASTKNRVFVETLGSEITLSSRLTLRGSNVFWIGIR